MRRGLALVLVVGVLGVLAVLGSAFAVLSRLERKSAMQRVWSTRAYLLARSGIEDARARLDAGMDPDAPRNRYGGEDWDLSGGALSALELQNEVHAPGRPDSDACPLRFAMRPSFSAHAGADPRLVPVEGLQRGYSGMLAGERGPETALYSLKVETGGLHVNGGDPARPDTDGYNAVLKRILGALADAIDRGDGVQDGAPVAQADGEALVSSASRPPGGWRSWPEVRDRALGGSARKLEALKPYLALHAWVDRKVIRPNPGATMPNKNQGTWNAIKMGHGAPGSRAPDFERIAGRIVGRAPVDLSWARGRREVLLALLAGLRGVYLDETTQSSALAGTTRPVELALDWSQPTDDCRGVVDQILASSSELSTWQQWDELCDSLDVTSANTWGASLPAQASDIRQAKRDLLKANFNPNSDLNKFNPDRSMARLVDKSDLFTYSTEFSLVPRGRPRISCVARLLDGQGRVLAARLLAAQASGDRHLGLTTQGEFVASDLGDHEVAGDEAGFRFYGETPYISPSRGTTRTFGARLLGNTGVSLQTAPDAQTVWGAGRPPAGYDGQLKLATIETGDGEYLPSGNPAAKMMFLAGWDDGVAADYSGGGGALGNAATVDARPPDANGVWDSTKPGVLYPDGLYVESGCRPGYKPLGNLSPYRGTASFWSKPNYDQTRSTAFELYRVFMNNSVGSSFNDGGGMGANTAAFWLLHVVQGRSLVSFWENMLHSADADSNWWEGWEQQRSTPGRDLTPHRWHLLTFLWDMNPPEMGRHNGDFSGRILVDRGDPGHPEDRNDPSQYYATYFADGTNYVHSRSPVDFSQQSQVFHLGNLGYLEAGPSSPLKSRGPDSTLDEFAIYDFGLVTGASGDSVDATEMLASRRFADGRFYKESAYAGLGRAGNAAGEWFSAPLDLGTIRLRRVSWTQIVPRGLRAPAVPSGKPEDGDGGPDGRILVDFSDLSGTSPPLDAAGIPVQDLFVRAQGSRVDRTLRPPFRLHAVFQPNLSDVQDKAVLDPLALDDISIAYRSADQPAFLGWREGEE